MVGSIRTQLTEVDDININPNITLFRNVFKKHSPFQMEELQQSYTGTADFGESITIDISASGTLLKDITFELVLPPVADVSSNGGFITNYGSYANWINAVGYAIYNSVELTINNYKIDKHTSLWYDVWNELTDTNKKEWSLVGKHETNYNMHSILTKKTKYILPLKFFFNRNAVLSLPINILGNNSVKLNVNFNSLNSLLLYEDSSATIGSASIDTFKVYAKYIQLGIDEERRINQSNNQLLIETMEYFQDYNLSNLSNINLSNPVKEIIWVMRHNSRISATNPQITNDLSVTNGNDPFNYSNTHINDTLGFNTYDIFSTMNIKIGNTNRLINDRDSLYFRKIQPYEYHSNVSNKNIYLYSFSLTPENYKPSGHHNFSKNGGSDKLSLNFNGIPGHSNNGETSSNYKINIFIPTYKYLQIRQNDIIFTDVPVLHSYDILKK